LEARLMTLADDIAYSVHDLEDFYRAGLIPLERLESNQGDEQDRFLEEVFGRLEPGHSLVLRRTEAEEAFRQFCKLIPVDAPYEGNESDRARLRSFTSGRIKDYVMNSLPNGDPSADLTKAHPSYLEIEMAKQLTWRYVITSPALAAQHCGQRRIVRELFDTLADAVSRERKAWRILPARHREQMERLGESASEADRLRLVADVIAGMTDTEAQQVYLRFTGHSPGSAFDPIVV
jgi:dGTPase